MHPSPRLVCSDRPEGHVLSCLDFSSTQAVSALCVRGSSISVQGPTLRAGPVSPRLHESRGGSPCSHERTGRPHPQLSRRLAHSRSVSGTVMRTQGFGAQSPQPVGPSGQLGKEQTVQRISFLGMELDSVKQSARLTEERAQSVLNCLNTFRGRTAVPLKLFQRLLGHMAAAAAVTPLGLLHMRPLHQMGMATRHVPSGNHSGMLPNLQPVVRPLVSSGRSSPRAGVPACCSLHGCLCHRLGGHVQWAGSLRGVDGPPTALAHQLPRVASSIPCPGPPEGAITGQACAGPYGQYCDRCVHQPSRRSALPSHVATRPPSPPLESEASEVTHSCPWCAQLCGRRALTSCAARRVATPPPGGPADLGGVRRSSGRPVCLARNLPLPVVLLPVRGNTRYRCTGAQLAPEPSQVCVSPSEPTCTDLVQSQGGRVAGLASCALLAQPDLVPGTHAPRDSPSLASSSEKGPSFSETGHPLAPASRPLETPCLVPGRDAEGTR